jgi:hypothetical protein
LQDAGGDEKAGFEDFLSKIGANFDMMAGGGESGGAGAAADGEGAGVSMDSKAQA